MRYIGLFILSLYANFLAAQNIAIVCDSKSPRIQFGAKKVEMYGIKIKNQIWDTAGQERYKSITNSYYKGAKGALVVYDITKKDTFQNVSKWINELRMNGDKDVIIVLVGNKSDLEEDRVITLEEASDFAKEQSKS